jgi:hypothetical protein
LDGGECEGKVAGLGEGDNPVNLAGTREADSELECHLEIGFINCGGIGERDGLGRWRFGGEGRCCNEIGHNALGEWRDGRSREEKCGQTRSREALHERYDNVV